MRRAFLIAMVCIIGGAACVDGKTPDCSTPDSGCFPTDGGGVVDASDASFDVATDVIGDVSPTDGMSTVDTSTD